MTPASRGIPRSGAHCGHLGRSSVVESPRIGPGAPHSQRLRSRRHLRSLVVGAETARANGQAPRRSIDQERGVLDIRPPAPLGVALRVADGIPCRGLLSTEIATSCHDESPSACSCISPCLAERAAYRRGESFVIGCRIPGFTGAVRPGWLPLDNRLCMITPGRSRWQGSERGRRSPRAGWSPWNT